MYHKKYKNLNITFFLSFLTNQIKRYVTSLNNELHIPKTHFFDLQLTIHKMFLKFIKNIGKI